jgi:hypothetical protein
VLDETGCLGGSIVCECITCLFSSGSCRIVGIRQGAIDNWSHRSWIDENGCHHRNITIRNAVFLVDLVNSAAEAPDHCSRSVSESNNKAVWNYTAPTDRGASIASSRGQVQPFASPGGIKGMKILALVLKWSCEPEIVRSEKNKTESW